MLQQIASQVGVDVSAVSRVLNNKADTIRIGRKRIVEIRRTAQDLGYRPNAAARAIRRGQFGCVALVLSDESAGRSRIGETRASVGQAFSTMLVPDVKIGAAAVEMLQYRIGHPTEGIRSRAITLGFAGGTSTAPPAEGRGTEP